MSFFTLKFRFFLVVILAFAPWSLVVWGSEELLPPSGQGDNSVPTTVQQEDFKLPGGHDEVNLQGTLLSKLEKFGSSLIEGGNKYVVPSVFVGSALYSVYLFLASGSVGLIFRSLGELYGIL